MVPRTKTEQQCRNEPVSRMETRYEYQFEQEYVPPRWHVISQTHSEWQLEESAPSCMVAPAVETPQNRVEAILYWEPVATPLR